MSARCPPRWLERILEWAVPAGLSGQGALGDLSEGFKRRAVQSPTRARVWYARQTASIVLYRLFATRGSALPSGASLLVADARWSLRSVRKHPGFALAVVSVLGLGLGANLGVFAVVDGTLENTSWWARADRTVSIWPDNLFSFGHVELYADEQRPYESVGGYVEQAFALRTPDGESRSVNGVVITPELFRELSVQPALGRPLDDEDAVFGLDAVAVIGEGLWRRAFGGDPEIVGRGVDIGGRAVTIVGVQGPGGVAPGGRAELWMPWVMDPRDDDYWKAQSHTLVGVLRAGADLDDAQRDLMAYTQRLSDLFPTFYPQGWADGLATVERADEAQRRLIATPLLLLLIGTGMLMLVTALNVGTLLLGRAIDRRQELAIRASLGAARHRIVSQLLVEGTMLTAPALAIGLVTASFGGRWIAALFVEEAVVVSSSILSTTVLMFSAGVAAAAWLVLNGVPIAHFLRTRGSGLAALPSSSARTQRGLVSVQAALATLLLVSATLLTATVDNLRRVPLGFEPRDMVTVELSTPEDRVASPVVARDLYDRLTARVGALPEVEAVGLTGWLPLRAEAPPTPINLRAAPVDPREAMRAPLHMVDPGFFRAFGVQASAGRLLEPGDRAVDAPSAVVVNETLARVLWPNGGAVGQWIAIDPHAWSSWAPVVGVIPDMRTGRIEGPMAPALYVALAESPSRDVTLVVRAAGAIRPSLAATLRQTVWDVDPMVPIRSISEMGDVVRAAYATSWVMMGLLIVLAALATGLGTIGVYAVLAHHVALNRRELGVRIALGADPRSVIASVVRSGLKLAGVGILVGSAGAIGSSRLLESMLFQVSALEPRAFLAPAAALAVAAAVAAWVPASRAGRLPPAEVLRSE